MRTNDKLAEAVDVLQELGLKEYEAKCFVGLTRLPTGTAKQLSEITDVPRTRVYDAIRVLEAQGLVEIQHSSPQQFRAVPLEEATETLRNQYEDRIGRLQNTLDSIEVVDQKTSHTQQVWAMSGRDAIENRANDHIENATEEVVLVVGDESLLTEELIATLDGVDPDVDLMIGVVTDALERQIERAVPEATTFTTGLDWLDAGESADEVLIGRMLLVDRSTILVSSLVPTSREEQAIFGEGFGNGLVVVARRLMAQGLLEERDPAATDP